MSTVLREGNRRCDAVCHHAAGSVCGCICKGKFHGSALTHPAELEQTKIHLQVVNHMLEEAVQPRLAFDATTPDETRKDEQNG